MFIKISILKLALINFIVTVTAGCTVIQVRNTDKVSTTIYPGFLSLQINENNNNFSVSSNGLGSYISNDEILIGYYSIQKVYLNDFSKSISIFFDNSFNLLNSPELE